MPSAPKPQKTETAKTRGGRQKRSDPPWKKTEREDARWLQDNYGKDTDPIIRHLVSSTGRLGQYPALGVDSTSEHAMGESKDRNAVPVWLRNLWIGAQQTCDGVVTDHELPKWLATAWAQLHQACMTRVGRRVPVLFLSFGQGPTPTFKFGDRTYKLPEMHVINREHHTELVRAWLAMAAIRDLVDECADEKALAHVYDELKEILRDSE